MLTDYTLGFASGFKIAIGVMVYALIFTALLGRWITAEEYGPSVILKGILLIPLGLLALATFNTLWYWLMLPFAKHFFGVEDFDTN
jgi:hypothetical protein